MNETRTARSNETANEPLDARSNETANEPFNSRSNETATRTVEPKPNQTKPNLPNPDPSQSDPDLEEKHHLTQSDHASADADFERFRQAYPVSRRVGGKTAKSAWKAATIGRNGTHLAAMLAALEQHKRSEQWQTPKLIPLMTTWLNQERWNQTLPESIRVSSAGQSTASAAQRVKDSLRRPQ